MVPLLCPLIIRAILFRPHSLRLEVCHPFLLFILARSPSMIIVLAQHAGPSPSLLWTAVRVNVDAYHEEGHSRRNRETPGWEELSWRRRLEAADLLVLSVFVLQMSDCVGCSHPTTGTHCCCSLEQRLLHLTHCCQRTGACVSGANGSLFMSPPAPLILMMQWWDALRMLNNWLSASTLAAGVKRSSPFLSSTPSSPVASGATRTSLLTRTWLVRVFSHPRQVRTPLFARPLSTSSSQ